MEATLMKNESATGKSFREHVRHYISASDDEIEKMMSAVGVKKLEDLYKEIDPEVIFKEIDLPEELSYDGVKARMLEIAAKNKPRLSFLGDGLQAYKEHEIVNHVSGIRNLTTTYTPYQPERSQGTLISLWIYQCMMSMLTGFEAINASLYDRSTAIYEGICCAIRIKRSGSIILIAEGILPQDRAVIESLNTGTEKDFRYVKLDPETGTLDLDDLKRQAHEAGSDLVGVVYPQVNSLGLLEDVDSITDFVKSVEALSIAVIDPMLLASGGLKPPVDFGESGANIIVGEAQHIAIAPNFGGPGLGIFGVRHNESCKNHIRVTPGRYVGKTVDTSGRESYAMILSTREQHIRKEKATSNICSNQSFLATLAGATLLARGEQGMKDACTAGYKNARLFEARIKKIAGVRRAFKESSYYNECVIEVPEAADKLLKRGDAAGLHLGVNVSGHVEGDKQMLKVSFSDIQGEEEIEELIDFLENCYGQETAESEGTRNISKTLLRHGNVGFPEYALEDIKDYYDKLGGLNISPDTGVFPLGSCTMKYNPEVNDWAAGLKGFKEMHPQMPLEDSQGCLEVLYEIQEWFKGITGLAGVTTQPVAGAQGELVSLKMFQAYHRHRGDIGRCKVLIPKSAHGTNFATAIMAGIKEENILIMESDSTGRIDQAHLDKQLEEHGKELLGVMVTNPNTSGIFESGFKTMAEKVHRAGGLIFMDGANLNAIAGWVNLEKLGVDAVHSNLHKTFTIPHGGGGPGDAIVAVSNRLLDFMPGKQIEKKGDSFTAETPKHSIGTFHRHWGNFAHKVRCYAYLLRLGKEGIRRMSSVAVLASRYLHEQLKAHFPTLPLGAEDVPRMHEFIISFNEEDFDRVKDVGIKKANSIPRIGKIFLDFGFHAPTVSFPEPLGLMIEPTESFTLAELDRFAEATIGVKQVIHNNPDYLNRAPQTTPIDRIDEVQANRNPVLSEKMSELPPIHEDRVSVLELAKTPISEIQDTILRS